MTDSLPGDFPVDEHAHRRLSRPFYNYYSVVLYHYPNVHCNPECILWIELLLIDGNSVLHDGRQPDGVGRHLQADRQLL